MEAEQFKLIDTAIGLIFIFLIISIVVTAAVEFIGSMLRLRSVNLVQGLIWILGDKPNPAAPSPGLRSRLAGLIIGHSKVATPVTPVVSNEAAAAAPDSLTAQMLKHPLIDNLAVGDRVTPHIDPKLFASVLVTVLNDAKNNTAPFDDINKAFANIAQLVSTVKNDTVRNALTPMVAQAQAAATTAEEKAKAAADAVAQWYDQSMSQASDWYKSRIQGLTLVLATVLVVGGNIDSIRIASALWSDAGLRQTFVAQASAAAADPDYLKSTCPEKQGADALECNVETAQKAYKDLNGLPLGWQPKDYASESVGNRILALLSHFPGWILSIAAASLGAPFWFGLLQKVTPLRVVKTDAAAGK